MTVDFEIIGSNSYFDLILLIVTSIMVFLLLGLIFLCQRSTTRPGHLHLYFPSAKTSFLVDYVDLSTKNSNTKQILCLCRSLLDLCQLSPFIEDLHIFPYVNRIFLNHSIAHRSQTLGDRSMREG